MIQFEIFDDTIELSQYACDTTLPQLVMELEEFRKDNELKTRNCKGCGECCQDNIPVLGLDIIKLTKGLNCSLDELKDKFLILPDPISPDSRSKSISEMVKMNKLEKIEATILYEYNNAEPIIVYKKRNGDCCLLEEIAIGNIGGSAMSNLEKVQERPQYVDSTSTSGALSLQKLCSIYNFRPFSCGLYLCNMGEKLSFLQEMIIRQGTWHAYSLLGWISEADIAHNPFLKTKNYDELLVKDFDFQFQNSLDQLFFYF